MKRKNNTEIELAKTRIDVMQVHTPPISHTNIIGFKKSSFIHILVRNFWGGKTVRKINFKKCVFPINFRGKI